MTKGTKRNASIFKIIPKYSVHQNLHMQPGKVAHVTEIGSFDHPPKKQSAHGSLYSQSSVKIPATKYKR